MRQDFKQLQTVALGQYKDRNFCTVAALAITLDWSFGKAHRHMAKHGRKNKRGMFERDWRPAIEEAAIKEGKRFEKYRGFWIAGVYGAETNNMTLKRFCREHPTGAYYVKVSGHAVAIIDGVMHDWTADTAGRRKIIGAYKLVDGE